MNREQFYAIMGGDGTLDYEVYLSTKTLLSCQLDYDKLCNADEMQFQIVHQIEELWMKLMAYTLLDIDEYLQQENTNRVITLFRRVHTAQKLMIQQLALLETMSPKEYQEIRKKLGKWKRAGIAGISRAAEDVPADLELVQSELFGQAWADDREDLRFGVQPRRRLHGGRTAGGIRRTVSEISLRAHAADLPHDWLRFEVAERPACRDS